MRTPLLGALALLCGAEVTYAQTSPAYSNYGYYQGYGYQAMPAYGYRMMGATPYYQGNPAGYYSANPTGYQGYYYPTQPAKPATPADGSVTPAKQAEVPPAPAPMTAAPPASAPAACPVPEPAFSTEHPAADVAAPRPDAPCHDKCWFQADYMLSFFRTEKVNIPLVTIGSNADPIPGAIGQPGTTVLFSTSDVDYGAFSGVHLEAGIFLDDSGRYSLELGGQYAFQRSLSFTKASDANGNPLIGRPFFDVTTDQEAIDQVSNSAAGFAGVTDVISTSELYGAELNGRINFQPWKALHADMLVGFRYLHLNESLSMSDQITPTFGGLTFQGNAVTAPDTLADQDSFQTANDFYGLQVGGRVGWQANWFSISAFGKVAMGATDEQVTINGSTTHTFAGGSQVASGGVLALPSNIGSFERVTFGVVPELGLNLGVHLTPHVELTAGYSFLYWDGVVRPGAQIDRFVNPTLVPLSANFGIPTATPTETRPVFTFVDEAFWVHNLTVGLDIHY